ncbi:hypothetical protein BAG01nite_49150 [Brevibacillus agri]|uniref:Uncharacterized protein n=1 Tax=Brevibacillus agri TaxID=51101 RepID=A0ABQ0SZ83_9BACL|nr:hypothetical protein BAG01nite_49150 [Brevibacillus agri]
MPIKIADHMENSRYGLEQVCSPYIPIENNARGEAFESQHSFVASIDNTRKPGIPYDRSQ